MIIYALSHFCGLLWRRSSEGGNDFGKDQSNPFQARCILNKKSIVSIVSKVLKTHLSQPNRPFLPVAVRGKFTGVMKILRNVVK